MRQLHLHLYLPPAQLIWELLDSEAAGDSWMNTGGELERFFPIDLGNLDVFGPSINDER
jgi:hypothetical protein